MHVAGGRANAPAFSLYLKLAGFGFRLQKAETGFEYRFFLFIVFKASCLWIQTSKG